MSTQTTHRLKTWPGPYQAVADGRKTFEVRQDDRGYKVGDRLELIEHSIHTGPTGRSSTYTITFIARPSTLVPIAAGYVILALGPA